MFFVSSRRRHTRCALVTGVQTCALPIFEKRRLTPKEVNNGEALPASSRAFALLEIDEVHLDRLGLRWETIVDTHRRWLHIDDYPLPSGYTVERTKLALEIPPNYPGAQIYGFHASPLLGVPAVRYIDTTPLRGIRKS